MELTFSNSTSKSAPASASSIIMLSASGDGKESQPSTSSSSTTVQWSQPCQQFELEEIQLGTKDFDESLVVGKGGFAKVYKGTFYDGPTPVDAAIKRLKSTSDKGAAEFWAEVEMLSKLSHSHLLSLIGYCFHEKEMILMYEYMPHGSLEDYLHKLHTPLSWLQRLTICIGVGRGLDYLHTGTEIESGIIHRDVKSANILLDQNLEAKISDFGLSRTGAMNQPLSYVETAVKGTFGYLDPNYFTTGRLTRKSDVYAFGVVMLEVLCRKRAVDKSLDEDQWGLVAWAQDSIEKGNLKHIIDPDIRDQISKKCLRKFVRVANRCLQRHPKQRPTMAEVVSVLDSVVTFEQEKINRSLQAEGRTIAGRILDIIPFPSTGDNSGGMIREVLSRLSDTIIIHVIENTLQYRFRLTQTREPIMRIKPFFDEMMKLYRGLDPPKRETDMFMDQMKRAEELILKCEHIRWNFFKRYRYLSKLEALNESLLRSIQVDVALQGATDVKDVLVEVKDVQRIMEKGSSSG